MDPGLLILVLFGPAVLLAFLARTRFAWLPGVLVLISACIVFGTIKPVGHDDVGGLGALANGVMALAAIGLSVYGLILLVVAASLHRKRRAPEPTALPVATAVAGVRRPD